MSKHFMSKQAKIIAATTFLLGVFAVGGMGLAYADTSVTKTDPMTTLSARLAQKFNLNADEVKAVVDGVFEEEHKKMEAQWTQNNAEKISKAVSDGTITKTQADLLTAKIAEIAARRDSDRASFAGLTDAERKTKMDAYRTELDAWMKSNNIPTQFAAPLFGKGRGHGHYQKKDI